MKVGIVGFKGIEMVEAALEAKDRGITIITENDLSEQSLKGIREVYPEYGRYVHDFIINAPPPIPDIFAPRPPYERIRPNVDIIAEHALIQQKKSKLSRSDREWVIQTYNTL
jgi:hypothetical protein